MLPRFTAEAALQSSNSYRMRPLVVDGTAIAPQQRGPEGSRGPGGPLELTPSVLTCPGCWTHSCGFLGLSTCLTCC